MGCDIHCYIEYRERDINKENERWCSFGGRINPGRNYLMFNLMAGIRGRGGLFGVKGLPEQLGYYSNNDNYRYIAAADDKECNCGECRTVSAATAARWVGSGSSKYKNDTNGNPTWVSDPDWHSHSWLSLAEFKRVLETYQIEENKQWEELEKSRIEILNKLEEDKREKSWLSVPCKHYLEERYQAIAAAMEKFEELGYESRLVFWFDN